MNLVVKIPGTTYAHSFIGEVRSQPGTKRKIEFTTPEEASGSFPQISSKSWHAYGDEVARVVSENAEGLVVECVKMPNMVAFLEGLTNRARL